MGSLKNRIKRIELTVSELIPHEKYAKSQVSEEEIKKRTDNLNFILEQMDPCDKEEFLEGLQKFIKKEDIEFSLYKPLHLGLDYILDPSIPVYLGPKAYKAYKNGAYAIHSCSDCGCKVPIHCGYTQYKNGKPEVVKAKKVFESCPLCGGETGYGTANTNKKAL